METKTVEPSTREITPSIATIATSDDSSPLEAAPTPEGAAAHQTNQATSPIDSHKSRPLPEGWAPRFWPKILHREFEPCKKPAEDVVPEDTARLDYEIVLRCGRDEVVRVKSQLVLPMALEVENLAQTDVSFPELVDQVIVRPVVTKFRSFLQKRFDAATRAAIEKEAAPVRQQPCEPPTKNVKLPRPVNGAAFCMPTILTKPITATMPGSFPPPVAKNGG